MRDKTKLTAKQSEILEFLKASILEKGYPPSIREICAAVNLKSTSSVHAYLEALENKGYISKDSHNSRSIKILDSSFNNGSSFAEDMPSPEPSGNENTEMVMVPIVGTVAAGVPILAAEQIESYFPVPADRLPNRQTFFLRVKGDSMVNAGILDKDLVLVEQKNDAENGDIVVALIDDSATVKTFYKENGYVRLQPQNDYMEPIIVKDKLTILGKVIGDMRFFN
ncbi:MAG TPA: transcriptional repressor LexA [Candidatus Alectryocaccobium stercorigallinarum]|nr:transcriptional repressor LexA [Candidatus Alectryocaccobium stercorigallinarum]